MDEVKEKVIREVEVKNGGRKERRVGLWKVNMQDGGGTERKIKSVGI